MTGQIKKSVPLLLKQAEMASIDTWFALRIAIAAFGAALFMSAAISTTPVVYPVSAEERGVISLWSVGLERISGAINNLRSIAGGTRSLSHTSRALQELEARRLVLQSVIDYLLQEAQQAHIQLNALVDLDPFIKQRLANELDDNTLWFNGMSQNIRSGRSADQLRIMANDIQQYRRNHHTILIRQISTLSLFQRQEIMLATAGDRLEKIQSDLTSLEKNDIDTAEFRVLFQNAAAHVQGGNASLNQAQLILKRIIPAYDEARHLEQINTAQQLIHESYVSVRAAYKLFITMAQRAGGV